MNAIPMPIIDPPTRPIPIQSMAATVWGAVPAVEMPGDETRCMRCQSAPCVCDEEYLR